MRKYDIAVIGGGPAGMMAAIAAPKDLNVVLLEKNPELGCKLLLTGGGRCNITNNKPPKKLLKMFKEKNFLKHSFYTLTNEKLLSYFNLEFSEEDDNRVFPENGDAGDVLAELKKHLTDVDIKLNYEVCEIKDSFTINNEIKADKIIIATGGVTYPHTGCSPKNYFLTNHPLTKIRYGLSPLVTTQNLRDIAGITLYDVVVSYKKIKVKGNVLISHTGLTGPGIINLSSEISRNMEYDILDNGQSDKFEIAIDLCPNYTREELREKFNNDFRGKSIIKNYLKVFLTANFIDYFLDTIGIESDVQLSQINKKSKNRLIESLKRFTFEIKGFNHELSKVTVGGVDLKNINPKTMESKITPNLYFAGEVLDLDGPTGGYNLKIAFSTGYLAGISSSSHGKTG